MKRLIFLYFSLCVDADLRMVADENLNRAIRSLGESNITRIQVQRYYIKKYNFLHSLYLGVTVMFLFVNNKHASPQVDKYSN